MFEGLFIKGLLGCRVSEGWLHRDITLFNGVLEANDNVKMIFVILF
jgi:hypothetical protein